MSLEKLRQNLKVRNLEVRNYVIFYFDFLKYKTETAKRAKTLPLKMFGMGQKV